uniref:Integrin_alpha2 domain-containing protein n=1 Tax=Heterorhabditis bacteriophora TaxID=37862 RepID=A0A1I7XD82_HETBA
MLDTNHSLVIEDVIRYGKKPLTARDFEGDSTKHTQFWICEPLEMQDYLIVIISILSGVVVLSVLFLLCFYYIKRSKANARRKPARAASSE